MEAAGFVARPLPRQDGEGLIIVSLRERVLGCLTGVGVGDALGMPTEFLSPQQIKKYFGELRTFERTPEWHPLSYMPAGSMTDDTEQTLAIAGVVIEKGRFDASDIAQALLKWSESLDLSSLDRMGPNTNYSLKRLRAGDDPYQTGLRGNTNGAAMRISPIGCIHAGKPENVLDDVITACVPTHLTDVGVAGAAAVASGIAEALNEDSNIDRVIEAMFVGAQKGEAKAREVIELTTQGRVPWEVISAQINPSLVHRMEWALEVVAETSGSPAERRDVLARAVGTGVHMIETIPFVVGVLKIVDGDPFEAMVLGANAGGDTDSLASIAGGIAGALHGVSTIPQDLVRQFEQVNEITLEPVADGLISRIKK